LAGQTKLGQFDHTLKQPKGIGREIAQQNTATVGVGQALSRLMQILNRDIKRQRATRLAQDSIERDARRRFRDNIQSIIVGANFKYRDNMWMAHLGERIEFGAESLTNRIIGRQCR
jgi:hypothetical protein